MKVHFVTALGAAALLAACSGSNKETRTASNTANTGTSTQGSAEGTQSAAGSQGQVSTQGSTQAGTSGSATASTGSSTDTSAMGNDRSGQATTSAQNNPDTSSSGSTYGQSGTSGGSTYGQSGTGSSGSTYGQSGTGSTSDSNMGTSGSRGSMDRSASASSVAKVDQDNKTVVISSRQGDRITLTVDDDTQIVDNRSGNTGDLSSIREGTPVRATFDAASNRAQKIEVMSRAGRRAHKSASTDTGDPSDSKATTPNPNTAKNPAQDATGRQSPPQDQK